MASRMRRLQGMLLISGEAFRTEPVVHSSSPARPCPWPCPSGATDLYKQPQTSPWVGTSPWVVDVHGNTKGTSQSFRPRP